MRGLHHFIGGVFLLAIGLAGRPAEAILIDEYFNDYGTTSNNLADGGHDGGHGWNGAWTGVVQAEYYFAGQNQFYNQAGYSNAGNESDGDDGMASHIGYWAVFRDFASPLSGQFWTSFVFTLGGGGSRYVAIERDWLPIDAYGVDSQSRTYATLDGTTYNYGATVPGNIPCLGLAKWNIDPSGPDSVEFWVNPPDLLHGEAGLGPPLASSQGIDALSSLSHFGMELGNGSAVDSIRVSYGASSAEELYEVLAGVVPEPSAAALLMAACVGRLRYSIRLIPRGICSA